MLVVLQAVLGFDNLLYISLESKRAPEEKQSYVRKLGIGIAVILRIGLLFGLVNLIEYVNIELFGFDFEEKSDGTYNRFSFTIGSVFYLLFVIIISKISISIFRVLIHRSTREKKWIDEGGTYTIIQLSKYVI